MLECHGLLCLLYMLLGWLFASTFKRTHMACPWLFACQNPLLGNVLRLSSHCIHERNPEEIQIQLNKREQTPPQMINSNGQIKSGSKNLCLNSQKSYN